MLDESFFNRVTVPFFLALVFLMGFSSRFGRGAVEADLEC